MDKALDKAIDHVTAAMPGGGEDRPGQRQMAQAVATAIAGERHLVVQAGTGTGKSLAYLIPAILSGRRVVVATATKALQDQLATRDLPLLAASLDKEFSFAVLKGRSNYLCRQRAGELTSGRGQGELSSIGVSTDGASRASALEQQVSRLLAWAEHSATGDRAELSFEPSPSAWGLLSVGTDDCPGRSRCPSGNDCFAEIARERAADADIVVTNMHLYGAHLANDSTVLPAHEVVVFDEAHELEDIATASLGLEIGAGQLKGFARASRPLLAKADAEAAAELEAAGDRLDQALSPLVGSRLTPAELTDSALSQALELTGERLARLTSALRSPSGTQGSLHIDIASTAGSLADPARARALQSAGKLAEDLAKLNRLGSNDVAWVEARRAAETGGSSPVSLRVAPIEVGATLAALLWGEVTAILTSATIPLGIGERLGIPADDHDSADVGSPFPYPTHALLYCAAHLPDRRHPNADRDLHDELACLINMAGGRTLGLFTSWRAMTEAARAVAGKVRFRILTQDELPKPALLAAFAGDESVCLFATMGFWQGVDVPGPTLSLVAIDRIPFPRPDDPLLSARRERAGAAAFRTIDLPRASMLLAQGAGRLIRSSADRGVVAVLDRRLAHAGYRWDLVRALPPMARTRQRSEVSQFLAVALGRPEALAGPAQASR